MNLQHRSRRVRLGVTAIPFLVALVLSLTVPLLIDLPEDASFLAFLILGFVTMIPLANEVCYGR